METTLTEVTKLDNLVKKTNRRILSIQSVFPFDFFPDTVHIDENKVDVIHRTFFWEKQMFPILIKNINGANITTNPFFATLSIEVTGYEKNPRPIRFLKRNDAVRARRIILGLVACAKEGRKGIDLSKIPLTELREKVEEIGKSREHDGI